MTTASAASGKSTVRSKAASQRATRRWLDHGPWGVERGAEDLTFVVFHDPTADATTSLAQAMPDHQRIGISEQGGFMQSNYVFKHELKGFYLPAQRQMRILASGVDLLPHQRQERWPVRVITFGRMMVQHSPRTIRRARRRA